jgi:hypothetical protein
LLLRGLCEKKNQFPNAGVEPPVKILISNVVGSLQRGTVKPPQQIGFAHPKKSHL